MTPGKLRCTAKHYIAVREMDSRLCTSRDGGPISRQSSVDGDRTGVDRSQVELKVEGISDDLRFQAACNGGVLTLANIGSAGQGHHQRVIESLRSQKSRSPHQENDSTWGLLRAEPGSLIP